MERHLEITADVETEQREMGHWRARILENYVLELAHSVAVHMEGADLEHHRHRKIIEQREQEVSAAKADLANCQQQLQHAEARAEELQCALEAAEAPRVSSESDVEAELNELKRTHATAVQGFQEYRDVAKGWAAAVDELDALKAGLAVTAAASKSRIGELESEVATLHAKIESMTDSTDQEGGHASEINPHGHWGESGVGSDPAWHDEEILEALDWLRNEHGVTGGIDAAMDWLKHQHSEQAVEKLQADHQATVERLEREHQAASELATVAEEYYRATVEQLRQEHRVETAQWDTQRCWLEDEVARLQQEGLLGGADREKMQQRHQAELDQKNELVRQHVAELEELKQRHDATALEWESARRILEGEVAGLQEVNRLLSTSISAESFNDYDTSDLTRCSR